MLSGYITTLKNKQKLEIMFSWRYSNVSNSKVVMYILHTEILNRVYSIQERLEEKQKLLYQLEKQEKDFLGIDNQNKGTDA